jgi:hypothetical protein
MPGVASPDNPLLPAAEGWNYSSVLPFAARQQPAQPVQGTDESGKSQQFTSPSVGFALPEVLRSSINELTSAVTLPGRVFQGQVAPADMNKQAIGASLALMGAGFGVNSITGETAGSAMGTIRGWHGTPHTFEPVEGNPFGEFKQEAIGSGEGAASYGHGHYIAGNPATAESYKERLSAGLNPTMNELQKYFKPGNIVSSYGGGKDKVLEFISGGPAGSQNWSVKVQQVDVKGKPLPGISGRIRQHATPPSDQELEKAGVKEPRGSLLQVEVKPEEHELLDWDKTVGEQSKEVQDALKKAATSVNDPIIKRALVDKAMPGESLYHHLRGYGVDDLLPHMNLDPGVIGGDELTSKFLHSAGIPGIKYLDQGSRGLRQPETIQADIDSIKKNISNFHPSNKFATGGLKNQLDSLQAELTRVKSPTSNYVIFHPSNLKITGRNGEELAPVEHDPFNPGGKRIFTPAELAKGRETTVSLARPAEQNARRQAQAPDPILGLTEAVAEQKKALDQWVDKATTPQNPKPSALALAARRKAEEAMEAEEKRKRKKGSQ